MSALTSGLSFSVAVEGPIDEAVLHRVAALTMYSVGPVFGKNGKDALLRSLPGYNHAARFGQPWLVLVDLDRSADCAPPALAQWLPDPAPGMCFRIAVREVESWLLADVETLASYLAISPGLIPRQPEALDDPKATLVQLAGRSRRSDVRRDILPREGGGRQVGPNYTARMIEYSQRFWRPEVAMTQADSLRRLIGRLREMGGKVD